jgi:hypothetical protein
LAERGISADQQEIAMGLVRQISIPGLRIQRMFSWALPSGELGGLPGEFYQFANSIRKRVIRGERYRAG